MDYDDNDFQSHNLHLAGEGSSKFPPVLRPYALPKFDFDDSLHGPLRFDSLVETEVFLGIESNEDNQWIEDFSQGNSGIQFSSSAAESCSISRRNNVWSEATSSESVEMLLKSVGQEEITPVQSNTKESDACDELGCIIKHMEPSLKQDNNTPSGTGNIADLQPTLLPEGTPKNFSVLDNDGGMQQTMVEDGSQSHKGDASFDGGLGDLTAITVDVGLTVTEGTSSVDDKWNDSCQRKGGDVVNGSLNNMSQKSSASGMQGDDVVTSVQNIVVGNELNNKDASNHANVTTSDNINDLETDNGENREEEHVLTHEAQVEDRTLDVHMIDSGTSQSENPPSLAPVDSMEEAKNIESKLNNAEEPSCITATEDSGFSKDIEIGNQSSIKTHVLLMGTDDNNSSSAKHEVGDSSVSQLDDMYLEGKDRASLVSVEDRKISKDNIDGSGSSDAGGNSSLTLVASSAGILGDAHAEGHVSSSILAESVQLCVNTVPGLEYLPKIDQDVPVGSLSFGKDSSENELIVSKLPSDPASGNESVPSGDGSSSDAVVDHKDAKVSSPLVMQLNCSDKEEEIANKISIEASLSDLKTSSGVTTGLDSVSGSEKGPSAGAAQQVLCESADQALSMVDACIAESRSEPQAVVINNVGPECAEEMKACPVFGDSNAEKGESSEALVKEIDGKESSKVSEPTLNSNEMLVPVTEAKEESGLVTSKKGQEGNDSTTVCGDASYRQTAVSSTNECGSDADLDKSAGGSPIVIRSAELSQKSDKEGVKGSAEQTSVDGIADGEASKVCSVSQDPKQNDSSKDSFTFEVTPLGNIPEKEAGQKWQPFSDIQIRATKMGSIVDVSPSTSGLGQLDPKIGQDISHGSPKVSDGVGSVRSGSKGTSERRRRRASGKATGKESAKKGNHAKETISLRLEKGEKITNVSVSSSGITQLVQSSEMQRYGHVDSNSVKSLVIASSTSSLPDLNSSASPSAMFQQPFTDLQQVQLRAQIFVYGALIQGTAPDEAYMISAFGGPDGGRSAWENAWHSCIERLHGQKSHLITPETHLQSRSGARANDAVIKQSGLQGKAVASPAGRASSKGVPSTVVSPIVPLSSPLWSIPTPSVDTLQSSGMPRGPAMDYQRPLSPLHPHQTPPIRNFVGHNPWISQPPFCGPWVASSPTSALDTSRFSVQIPITETVQLTPVKELSVPHSSGAKHVSSGPMAQSGISLPAFTGTSPLPDAKKVTASSGQPSSDPKSRKRKKASVPDNPGRDILHPQLQTESVPVPAITSHLTTSTPVTFVSKAPTEKFVTSVSLLSTEFRKGDQTAEQKATLSEETLVKLQEARMHAEGATALATAAVSHSQEIWNQLDKQRNSSLLPDVATKLGYAAVAIAAAAAVAKAAAAAANVASNAALQAKLFADEAVVSGGCSNPRQISAISVSDGVKNLGQATPASILKGADGTNSSSSILFAAREAAKRRVEAASAASKQAENMDAIVKAAELAAEAVSQAGKIVAMGDPLSLSELVAAGPEGYWKVAQITSELVSKSHNVGSEILNVDNVGGCQDTSARNLKAGPSDKNEAQIANHRKPPTPREMSTEGHLRLVDGSSGGAANAKDAKGQRGRKASDLAKSENGSKSPANFQNENEKVAESLKENSIKEGSHVEVFKDGSGFKAGWCSATVLCLKDGKAYVSYSELPLGEGSEKLKEWVALNGEGDEAPKIRIARPITAMPFEGTRKRRRAAMGDYTWSVGDRVDAWMQDSWWEGVITEQSKKDETMLTVHFPVQGETSVVKAWNLRPSFIWKDGEWIEWSSSRENSRSSYGGDTPQEKRPRVRSPVVEAKGKDKASKTIDSMVPDKPNEPTLLDLSAEEKLFNIGKSTRDENKPDKLRMTRTGLQEGSRVIFGVPKPGKKRKFMEVSKHYVADRGSKINEANDAAKFAKYLMPQGSGPRGWRSTSKTESHEKRVAISKPKVVKYGKQQNVSGRTIPQKENLLSGAVSAPDDSAVTEVVVKTKDSVSYVENTLGKQNLMEFQSSGSEGMAEGPILFASLAPPSDTVSSKKMSISNAKPERVSKGKLAPAGGKLGKIDEDKVFNGSSAKLISDVVEPRRSNRRIQPTSRLLEGLQSSLMVSKIPSVSHDKSQKSRGASRGNNHG